MSAKRAGVLLMLRTEALRSNERLPLLSENEMLGSRNVPFDIFALAERFNSSLKDANLGMMQARSCGQMFAAMFASALSLLMKFSFCLKDSKPTFPLA